MNNKISVLSKMANSAKEGGDSKYVVPANSEANVSAVGIEHKQHHRQVGTATTTAAAHQCPNCENMAKNFLYLESLLRENSANKKQCAQCKSLSKYLQHINRNIMQTFSNFEAVVKSFKGSLKGKGDALGSPKLKKKAKKSTKNRNDEVTIMTTTLGGSKRRLAGGDNKVSEIKISTAVYKKKNAKSASKKAASKKGASTKGSALSRKRKSKKDDEKSTTSATDKKPKTKLATKKTKSKSAADKTDKPKLPKTKASSSKKNKKSKSIDKKVKNTVRDITKRVLGLA